MFQSRNRESYLFKSPAFVRPLPPVLWFQSRNRESYLFKFLEKAASKKSRIGFNLVIENLIFSRNSMITDGEFFYRSFNLVIENLIFSSAECHVHLLFDLRSFNLVIENLIFSRLSPESRQEPVTVRFNLVIENLIFSSALFGQVPIGTRSARFNLVIENLIFSSLGRRTVSICSGLFQSRNRESYLFKQAHFSEGLAVAIVFQSRNRESYLFKSVSVSRRVKSSWSFNLVIENLIFSRFTPNRERTKAIRFQSRNRESYLFK